VRIAAASLSSHVGVLFGDKEASRSAIVAVALTILVLLVGVGSFSD